MRVTESTEDDGTWQQLVNIEDIDGVRELYVLVGCALDLQFAAESFERFRTLTEAFDESHEFDQVAAFAYISAAVIAYNRCFSTGVRGGLSVDNLDDLPQDKPGAAREIHRVITDLRDKHIAHSVSPFEFVMIGGMIGAPDANDCGVGVMTGVGLPFGAPQVTAFRDLTRALHYHITQRAKEKQDEIGASMVSHGLEDLAKRPPMQYRVPGLDEAGVAREFGRGKPPDDA